MTSIAERVPVERITEQAREAHPGRVAAMVLAAVLLRAGWLAARMLSVAWLGTAWCAIAVREGWREGRSPEWSAHAAQRRIRAERTGPR